MTDKEKKNKIADILLDFYDEYWSNEINRPMIPSIYAGKILDSMQEESVSENLEDAAKHYLYSNILYDDVYVGNPTDKDCIEMFKAGAQWQKEQDQSTIELAEDHAMLAGMEKMKEQMMTKSIEAVVSQVPCSNEIILYNPSSVDKYYLPQEMNKLGLNKGDKVKLIIIKEE